MGYPSLMFKSNELRPAINIMDLRDANVIVNVLSPIDTNKSGANLSTAAGLGKLNRMHTIGAPWQVGMTGPIGGFGNLILPTTA
jgi:hypothetical protein